MKRFELAAIHESYLRNYQKYRMVYYKKYNFNILKNNILSIKRNGKSKESYSDCIIALDTETSKSENIDEYHPEYDDILSSIKSVNIKITEDLFEAISKAECKKVGFNFTTGKGQYIDDLYDEIREKYFWIFPDEFNHSDILYNLYQYLLIHKPNEPNIDNYIVAWTISIRAYHLNLVTLYGHDPLELCECLSILRENLPGELIKIYVHNLNYDWFFLKKFLIAEFKVPENQLNTAPHKPLFIQFSNGLRLQDSYILAQRSLEKWANDLDVEHKKAKGSWDYNQIRHQHDYEFSADELLYIQNDTLAMCECIDATMQVLKKNIITIPFTATGIPRMDIIRIGREYKAKDWFNNMLAEFDIYSRIFLSAFHGGYVHANRYMIEQVIKLLVKCYDITSSYPFRLLVDKFPISKFVPISGMKVDDILKQSEDHAFMFKLTLINVRLKDPEYPMPVLQYSKKIDCLNEVIDNGRVRSADMFSCYITEIDLRVIDKIYKADGWIVDDCIFARKDYLPKWFRDYIFQLFIDKSKLKYIDPIRYQIQKAKLNSCFGMSVQHAYAEDIIEDYDTGEYHIDDKFDPEKSYEKSYVNNRNRILPYQLGIYVTAYAEEALFEIGSLCDLWIYSDTDSVYGHGWDEEKVKLYNEKQLQRLRNAGYDKVIIDDKEFIIGQIVSEGDNDLYTEFKVLGAKRYCGRCKADNKLHITVAGVPKKTGAKCLNDDIRNFTKGFIFKGTITGKLQHTYIQKDRIITNSFGDYIGDSIDLTECDYKLDNAFSEIEDIKGILYNEEYLPVFTESEVKNAIKI